MILVIDGKTYPRVTVDDLSLKHALELQRELVARDLSSAKSWGEVKALIEEFAAQSDASRARNPEALFLSAVTIWATRVCAGDDVSLLEAIDIAPSSVKWVEEPEDKQAAEGKALARPRSGATKRAPKAPSAPST